MPNGKYGSVFQMLSKSKALCVFIDPLSLPSNLNFL